jgi:uncharacterized membrane protein HdeD (DUF308 family)
MLQIIEGALKEMARHWWLFVLRGVLAIIFGILVVVWPISGIFTLVILFGAYALVDGLFFIIFGIRYKRDGSSRGWPIFSGIIGVAAGVVALAWPGITAVVLLMIIAVWAFLLGILQVIFAFATTTHVGYRLLLALSGVFSIIFGIFLVARPDLGALAVIWIIGIFAVMSGAYGISFGLSLKGSGNTPAK